MGRGDVDEAVRARARRSGILAARHEVARGWNALERGKGDGQIDGAPDGRTPGWRGRPGVRGGGEHVFAKVWTAPDGSGCVQAILHTRYRAVREPAPVLHRRAQRGPDVDLRAHPVDDVGREAARRRVAAQVRGADAGGGGLKDRLVD